MTIISVSDVRNRSGAPSSLINDDSIEHAIEIVEESMKKYLNCEFTPKQDIEVLTSDRKNYFYTTEIPLLTVRELKSDDNTLDVSKLHTYRSGKVILSNDADISLLSTNQKGITIKYIHGYVTETDTDTETTSDASSGSSVALDVSDSSDFASNDWVKIIGMDGNEEVAKITSTSSGQITVDKLIKDHESGSIVTKVDTPEFIKQYLELETAIYVAINAVGATYTFNASYSLGDLNIQKGVPYTHWSESLKQNMKERNEMKKRVKPRIKIV